MATLSGKSPASTYKSLMKIADEANGLTASLSKVEDGSGQASAAKLSTTKFAVCPASNSTSTIAIQNAAGTNLFTVDSSNSAVKAGTTLTHATTQLLTFSAQGLVPTAGSHYFVPCNSNTYTAHNPEVINGTSTDPATSYDGSTSTDDILGSLFFVPSNIVIDSVKAFVSSSSTNSASIKVHLNSYSFGDSGDSNDGNLTSGAEIAAGNATSVTNSVIRSVSCTITGSSSVSSSKVLACFVENETNTDPITLTIQVLYHFA